MNDISKEEMGILIAVRMKSSRLSNKALADITGKPMIVHLIERMKRVSNAEKIILCTSTHKDDKVLLEIAEKEGILHFAGSELDVMKRFIDATEKYNLKIVVRVTGDNPLTDPENIDRMIEEHINGNYDFTKSEHLPLGVNAEVISVSTLKKAYETAEDTSLTEYMTTYLKRPEFFNIYIIKNNEKFFNNRSLTRLTVDYKEDLQVMNKIYGKLYPLNPAFSIRDVLLFLDNNPEVLKINANVLQIPLPKIRYKGEKIYEKKIVLVGKDMAGITTTIVEALKNMDEYEIIGFVHDSCDMQFSLVDGIPILGKCSEILKIKLDAQFFFNTFEDEKLRIKYNKILSEKGLTNIKVVDPQVEIPVGTKIGKGVFISGGTKIGKNVTISENVHVLGNISIPDNIVIPPDTNIRNEHDLNSLIQELFPINQ